MTTSVTNLRHSTGADSSVSRSIIKAVLIAGSVSLLSACGIFGGGDKEVEIIFDTNLGPDTKAQLKPLPKGVHADQSNKRHSSQSNAPADMAPEDK